MYVISYYFIEESESIFVWLVCLCFIIFYDVFVFIFLYLLMLKYFNFFHKAHYARKTHKVKLSVECILNLLYAFIYSNNLNIHLEILLHFVENKYICS